MDTGTPDNLNRPRPLSEVSRWIDVICGYEPEAFWGERFFALFSFNTWLRWPQSGRMIDHSELLTAAALVRAINLGEIDPGQGESHTRSLYPYLSPLRVADALLSSPLQLRSLWREFVEPDYCLSDVSSILAFFIRCPRDRRPSLNKALYFIAKNGFVDSDAGPAESQAESRLQKASVSVAKASWATHAIAAPFAFAAEYCETRLPGNQYITDVAPDEAGVIGHLSPLFAAKNRISRMFGVARFFRDQAAAAMGEASARRIEFPFSQAVKPVKVKVAPLDTEQLELVGSYSSTKR